MIEMSVESVRINQETQQRVLILQTLQQDRYLFIWIAHPEAYAIAVHLQGTQSYRPLTHDLMKSLVEVTGSKVLRVVISDLTEDPNLSSSKEGKTSDRESKSSNDSKIFFAQVVMDVAGKEIEVDARPSDAVALAVRANAPVLVAEHVLAEAGTTKELARTSSQAEQGPEHTGQSSTTEEPKSES